MAGTVIADRLEAASTSQLVIENGVALTPPTIVDVNNVQIGTFCRAWVNFNASSGIPVIGSSFNVSSITDRGVGLYTIVFTNAMTDANYCAGAISGRTGNQSIISQDYAIPPTSSQFPIKTAQFSGTLGDFEYNSVAIFR